MALVRTKALVAMLVVVALASAGCSASVSSLQESGDVAGLVKIAGDASIDYTKRADAFDALGELGTPEAVDALLLMLQDPDNASDAAVALGTAGDARAVEPLIAYLDSLEPTAEEYVTEQLRRLELAAAARALGGIQDPRALAALLGHLDAGHAASMSVEALGDALSGQGDTAVTALTARLANPNPNVWAPASLALGEILSDSPAQLSALLASRETYRIYLGVLRGGGGVPDAEMISALYAFNDLAMANAMLASGTEAARAAAEQWGRENGYVVRELQPWETTP